MKHLAKFYEGKNLMFGAFVEHFVIFLRVGEALDQRGVEKTLKQTGMEGVGEITAKMGGETNVYKILRRDIKAIQIGRKDI